jgi:hypothetical protein
MVAYIKDVNHKWTLCRDGVNIRELLPERGLQTSIKIILALFAQPIHFTASLDCIANFQHGESSGEHVSVMI